MRGHHFGQRIVHLAAQEDAVSFQFALAKRQNTVDELADIDGARLGGRLSEHERMLSITSVIRIPAFAI